MKKNWFIEGNFTTFLYSPEIFHLASFKIFFRLSPVVLKLSSIMSGVFLSFLGQRGSKEFVLPPCLLLENEHRKNILVLQLLSTWFNKLLIYLLMYFNKQLMLQFFFKKGLIIKKCHLSGSLKICFFYAFELKRT